MRHARSSFTVRSVSGNRVLRPHAKHEGLHAAPMSGLRMVADARQAALRPAGGAFERVRMTLISGRT